MATLSRLARHLDGIASWLGRNPWAASVMLVVAIAVPGIFRVEQIADDARRTADRVAAQQEEIARNRVEVCIQARQDTRFAIVETVRYTAQFFTNADEVREIADGLRPVLEDILPDALCTTIGAPDP